MATTTKSMKVISGIAATALASALCLGAVGTALAADEQQGAESYSYLSGQMHVSDRMATSEDVAADPDGNTDSTGNAFAGGIGYSFNAGAERGASYADAEHSDAEALVESGIIESTDEIDAYAAAKHEALSSHFEGLDSMTAQERHEHFSQFNQDAYAGDTVSELQSEGLID